MNGIFTQSVVQDHNSDQVSFWGEAEESCFWIVWGFIPRSLLCLCNGQSEIRHSRM